MTNTNTKTALVTGANKGIGFGIAKALGAKGYQVLVGARDEARGNEAVRQLTDLGYSAKFLRLDLSDKESIHRAADSLQDGSLDILVNNAGIAGNIASDRGLLDMGKSALDYTTADLKETIDVNFLATHGVIRNFLPKLTADGKILNVTVPVTAPFWAPLAYVTSKAAQNVLTITLGREFERIGSHRQIFGVMPGAVATDLNGASADKAIDGITHSVKTPDEAGENIVSFLFDGNNYNGKLVQFDGKVVTGYEHELFG